MWPPLIVFAKTIKGGILKWPPLIVFTENDNFDSGEKLDCKMTIKGDILKWPPLIVFAKIIKGGILVASFNCFERGFFGRKNELKEAF